MAQGFNAEADSDWLNFQQLAWYENTSYSSLLKLVFLRLSGERSRGDETLHDVNSCEENILVLYATYLDTVKNPVHKSDPHGFRLISKGMRLYLVEVRYQLGIVLGEVGVYWFLFGGRRWTHHCLVLTGVAWTLLYLFQTFWRQHNYN